VAFELTAAAIEANGLSCIEKMILCVLAHHAHSRTMVCTPSVARAAKMSGCSERSAQRAIKNLCRLGFLRASKRRNKTSVYFFNLSRNHQTSPALAKKFKASADKYATILKDPRWQKLRLYIFERDGFSCRSCGSTSETLHVHHERYVDGRLPWEYGDCDLTTLCEPCHRAASSPNDCGLV
jgi:hypothetical protein